MAKDQKIILGYIIMALLLINTYFLSGIWCSIKYGWAFKGLSCPYAQKGSGKICPLTGKALQTDKGSPKGSN